MTMKLPSEKAENFDIREQSITEGYVLVHTHSDGSETTFYIEEDYDIEVVRAGKDSTVMLRRVHKDGSSTTFTVEAGFYEEHADMLADYINDPEHEHDGQEKVPEGFKLVDDRPPICPNGCGLLAPVGHGDMECSACGYQRTVIDHKEE